MLRKPSVIGPSLVLVAMLTVACQTKGPAPGEALTEREDVIMAEPAGAPSSPSGAQALGIPSKGGKRDYKGYKGPHDPHGPAGHITTPDSHVSGPVDLVDVGGLQFKAPESWEYEHPSSAMRRAQFGVRDDEDSAGLVVYFFGNQGAGSVQANIDRWVGQFKNPDGSPIAAPKPLKQKIAGLDVTQVEVAGTYVGGMGAGAPQAEGQTGQRMIATIVQTPKGPFYFKFLGADKTVVENRKALEGLFASMTASK
jgi:hypothetical protein